MLHLKDFSILLNRRVFQYRPLKRANTNCSIVRKALLNKQHAKMPVLQQRRPYRAASTYIEEMYNSWLRDPTSVHRSWDSYFRNAPSLEEETDLPFMPNGLASLEAVSPIDRTIDEHLLVYDLIKAYQTEGHKIANLNPLSPISEAAVKGDSVKALCPTLNCDLLLGKDFRLPNSTYISSTSNVMPLSDIISRLEETYCQSIGVECAFLESAEENTWIRKHLESPGASKLDNMEQREILSRLSKTVAFEHFLARKFPQERRFSIEGCETLIPAMKKMIDVSSEAGVDSVIIGMPQRGRLNTVANVLRKPLRQIFSLFTGASHVDGELNDIKYWYGTNIERYNRISQRPIRLAIVASPSHSETYAPIVQGRVLAEQFLRGDDNGKQVMPIIVHNDASFYGQGIVSETINLTSLPNFKTHGTVHIVISDQTSDLNNSQCTSVARAASAPIFHVNADDPDAVTFVSKVAANWRIRFQKDVVLHLVGYRRQSGLNIDGEGIFIQPHLQQRVKRHKPCVETYAQKLYGKFVVTPDEHEKEVEQYIVSYEEAFEQAKKEVRFQKWFWIDAPWTEFFETKIPFKVLPTGVEAASLVDLANRFLAPPKLKPDFVLNKELSRMLADRKALVDSSKVDWALGEALAFGTLLNEGTHVRLSGQDVARGVLSQRHHVLHHMLQEKTTHNLLQNLYPNQATYTVAQSPLSEQSTLGFEVGYATTNPNALVLWEATNGDFSNAAQCIIDELIAGGQSNLVRQCGIVLLLPHGVDGTSFEHSTTQLERFLQLCADDPDNFQQDLGNFPFCQLRDTNWIVANCTTPANYFHILRRQIALPFRKPLVLFTPKSLLRHKQVLSSFDDINEGTAFQRVIPDQGPLCKDPREVKKLIFCSGSIYYDLAKKRAELNAETEIAIVRIEQLSPFPFDLIRMQAEMYEGAEMLWVQEEHKNQGAWSYVAPRFQTAITDNRSVCYTGRSASAKTATISKKQYDQEISDVINEAINLYSYGDCDNW